jgi:5'-3' exoribonuclease 1
MGIPKFFKWLTRRYPLILQNIKTEEDAPQVGKYVAVHLLDNFYLDLNGIVHNCIHGNDPKRHERISKLNDLEEVWAALMQ